MVTQEGFTLRKMAVEALEKSTRMLEVAMNLLKHGNRAEAERVRREARAQRTISTLLMAKASQLETNPSQSRHRN